jgi:hypothetical protein
MFSVVLYAFIAVAVTAAIIALLVVVLPDDHLARSAADVVPSGLPVHGEIGADDLAQVRIPVSVRGYRMVDTDVLLDRLGAEIERRDHEIASLRMQLPGGGAVGGGAVGDGAVGVPTVDALPGVSVDAPIVDDAEDEYLAAPEEATP